jgi:cytochrome c biogenesis protein CcmG, thiol:disulfide interchange protein DsbE
MLYRARERRRFKRMRLHLREAPVLVGIAVFLVNINAWAGAGAGAGAGSGPQRRLFPEAPDRAHLQTTLESSPLIGRMAPNLQATEWIGAPVDLREFRGKVVIVDFWASWSGVSRQQLASLRKLCDRYSGQVVMVGVTNLDGQTIDKVEDFVRKHRVPDFVAIDHNSLTHHAYQVREIPHIFLVDREGVVQFAAVGPDDARLAQELDRLTAASAE